jgi:hypothetical protein
MEREIRSARDFVIEPLAIAILVAQLPARSGRRRVRPVVD